MIEPHIEILDGREYALIVTITWDGVSDIRCPERAEGAISRTSAVRCLRLLADELEARSETAGGREKSGERPER